MHRRKMVMVSALAAVTVALSPLSAGASPSSSSATTPNAADNSGVGGEYPMMSQVQQEIDKLTAEMLAAADAANQAVGQASVAKEAAEQAKVDLADATAEAEVAQKQANQVAADMYKQGPMSLTEQTLLSANGPQDFMDKAILGDTVADYHAARITELVAAQKKLSDASTAADTAAADAQTKAEEAQQISSEIQTNLAAAQLQMNGLRVQAGLPPLAISDAPTSAAASTGISGELTGEWALPTNGTFTSCFCARWGTFHQGIDIANTIGTPIFSAGDGVVLRAGPATGFGLAVYIQHPNGDVTVYGHVNEYYVSAGQVVKAGQHIADIGNRGYSTGPHLHFEVQKGAYGSRVNPQAWLAERGIMVG